VGIRKPPKIAPWGLVDWREVSATVCTDAESGADLDAGRPAGQQVRLDDAGHHDHKAEDDERPEDTHLPDADVGLVAEPAQVGGGACNGGRDREVLVAHGVAVMQQGKGAGHGGDQGAADQNGHDEKSGVEEDGF
jgi:hypothetical protein